MKSKLIAMEPHRLQHHCHTICYRPAVFFRHFRLTALSFPQGKIIFLGVFEKLRKATVGFVMSAVRLSAWNNSAPNGRIFVQVI